MPNTTWLLVRRNLERRSRRTQCKLVDVSCMRSLHLAFSLLVLGVWFWWGFEASALHLENPGCPDRSLAIGCDDHWSASHSRGHWSGSSGVGSQPQSGGNGCIQRSVWQRVLMLPLTQRKGRTISTYLDGQDSPESDFISSRLQQPARPTIPIPMTTTTQLTTHYQTIGTTNTHDQKRRRH